MVALASLALQVTRSSFRRAIWKKKTCDTYFVLELTFEHEALALIPTRFGDFTDFFRDISLDNET